MLQGGASSKEIRIPLVHVQPRPAVLFDDRVDSIRFAACHLFCKIVRYIKEPPGVNRVVDVVAVKPNVIIVYQYADARSVDAQVGPGLWTIKFGIIVSIWNGYVIRNIDGSPRLCFDVKHVEAVRRVAIEDEDLRAHGDRA